MYLIKTPWWLRALYPSATWRIKEQQKKIYLSFDDGPHETATPFVLDLLKQYNARATFFCIGKNVAEHPAIYQRILNEGHTVGNHTYNHVKGWKVSDAIYLQEITDTKQLVQSNLFRPPYGRIRYSQLKKIQSQDFGMKTVMWDVLSGDFDTELAPEKCLHNVIRYTRPGSIIVFHDSTKAWPRLEYVLPKVLEHFSGQDYVFEAIPMHP